jgi:hypothetical protein
MASESHWDKEEEDEGEAIDCCFYFRGYLRVRSQQAMGKNTEAARPK